MQSNNPDLKARAQRVARHECGHYIVARALGFATGFCSVTINFPNGHKGEAETTLPTALRSISDIDAYLVRRVKVLYAGSLAEALDASGIDEKQALINIRTGGEQDHAKARELIHIIRDLRHPDTTTEDSQPELDAIELELWNGAADIVIAERDIIEGLGKRLASEVKDYETRAMLSADVIDALPSIQKRFPRQDPQ